MEKGVAQTSQTREIKVYFPNHRSPFIVPYIPGDRSNTIGNQVKHRIDAIASGMRRIDRDWFMVQAVTVKEDKQVRMIHGTSLQVMAEGLLKPGGEYLVLWTLESSNTKKNSINSAIEYINRRDDYSYDYYD